MLTHASLAARSPISFAAKTLVALTVRTICIESADGGGGAGPVWDDPDLGEDSPENLYNWETPSPAVVAECVALGWFLEQTRAVTDLREFLVSDELQIAYPNLCNYLSRAAG